MGGARGFLGVSVGSCFDEVEIFVEDPTFWLGKEGIVYKNAGCKAEDRAIVVQYGLILARRLDSPTNQSSIIPRNSLSI